MNIHFREDFPKNVNLLNVNVSKNFVSTKIEFSQTQLFDNARRLHRMIMKINFNFCRHLRRQTIPVLGEKINGDYCTYIYAIIAPRTVAFYVKSNYT